MHDAIFIWAIIKLAFFPFLVFLIKMGWEKIFFQAVPWIYLIFGIENFYWSYLRGTGGSWGGDADLARANGFLGIGYGLIFLVFIGIKYLFKNQVNVIYPVLILGMMAFSLFIKFQALIQVKYNGSVKPDPVYLFFFFYDALISALLAAGAFYFVLKSRDFWKEHKASDI